MWQKTAWWGGANGEVPEAPPMDIPTAPPMDVPAAPAVDIPGAPPVPETTCWTALPQTIWSKPFSEWVEADKQKYNECIVEAYTQAHALNEKTVADHLVDQHSKFEKRESQLLSEFDVARQAYEAKLTAYRTGGPDAPKLQDLQREYALLTDELAGVQALQLMDLQEEFEQQQQRLTACRYVDVDEAATRELKGSTARGRMPVFGPKECKDSEPAQWDPARTWKRFKGPWKANHSYAVGDLVRDPTGKFYVAPSAVDDVAPPAAPWKLVDLSDGLKTCCRRPLKAPSIALPATEPCPTVKPVEYMPAVGQRRQKLLTQCDPCPDGYTRVGSRCVRQDLLGRVNEFAQTRGRVPPIANAIDVLGTKLQVSRSEELEYLPTMERTLKDVYEDYGQKADQYIESARKHPERSVRAAVPRLAEFFYDVDPRTKRIRGKRNPVCKSSDDDWDGKRCVPNPERTCRKNPLKSWRNGKCADDPKKVCEIDPLKSFSADGKCVFDPVKCNRDPERSWNAEKQSCEIDPEKRRARLAARPQQTPLRKFARFSAMSRAEREKRKIQSWKDIPEETEAVPADPQEAFKVQLAEIPVTRIAREQQARLSASKERQRLAATVPKPAGGKARLPRSGRLRKHSSSYWSIALPQEWEDSREHWLRLAKRKFHFLEADAVKRYRGPGRQFRWTSPPSHNGLHISIDPDSAPKNVQDGFSVEFELDDPPVLHSQFATGSMKRALDHGKRRVPLLWVYLPVTLKNLDASCGKFPCHISVAVFSAFS